MISTFAECAGLMNNEARTSREKRGSRADGAQKDACWACAFHRLSWQMWGSKNLKYEVDLLAYSITNEQSEWSCDTNVSVSTCVLLCKAHPAHTETVQRKKKNHSVEAHLSLLWSVAQSRDVKPCLQALLLKFRHATVTLGRLRALLRVPKRKLPKIKH